MAEKATAKKATAKKATAKKGGRPATSMRASSSRPTPARRGDQIIIESGHVGSPAREGEILQVIAGEMTVSYRVRWSDGHETLITPGPGTARIVPA